MKKTGSEHSEVCGKQNKTCFIEPNTFLVLCVDAHVGLLTSMLVEAIEHSRYMGYHRPSRYVSGLSLACDDCPKSALREARLQTSPRIFTVCAEDMCDMGANRINNDCNANGLVTDNCCHLSTGSESGQIIRYSALCVRVCLLFVREICTHVLHVRSRGSIWYDCHKTRHC